MSDSSCKPTAMTASHRALFAGILDYAGLFPPAKLPLDTALANFRAYRQTNESWMLARFICPAGKLGDLTGWMAAQGVGASEWPFHLSVLGQGTATDTEAFFSLHGDDVDAMRHVRDAHPEWVSYDAFEVRLPPADGGSESSRSLLDRLRRPEGGGLASDIPLFVEVPPGQDWQSAWRESMQAIRTVNDSLHDEAAPIGFKLRCGGVEPAHFPSVERVAFVIAEATKAGVPLKFTAGLHHPLRHFNEAMGCEMHGFVNVFAAGVLARVHGMGQDGVAEILRAERWDDFGFDDEGLSFGDHRVDLAALTSQRAVACTSYGSCSFDEPREDLAEAGLL
ncbi:MAG: hypothetical protein ACPGXK_09575 [Phycisphaerae bacterium]